MLDQKILLELQEYIEEHLILNLHLQVLRMYGTRAHLLKAFILN